MAQPARLKTLSSLIDRIEASDGIQRGLAEVKHDRTHNLVIFTEHRDTLNYPGDRIRTLIGRAEAIVTIHGGMGREERRKAQDAFTQDKSVEGRRTATRSSSEITGSRMSEIRRHKFPR